MKLGLVAGGGDVPRLIAKHYVQQERPVFVVGLKGFTGDWINAVPHEICGIAEIGKQIKALKKAGCDTISMIGIVKRPDFSTLKPDMKGVSLLPRVLKSARQGDDALLRELISIFEEEGFNVVGAQELVSELKAQKTVYHGVGLTDALKEDITRAFTVAGEIGRLDIGQGVVVAEGLVLAVEAQEGTDLMLERVATLPDTLKGKDGNRSGCLLKRPKPIQEERIDLPTIGPGTIERAAKAGLSAVVVVENGALMVHLDKMIALCQEYGVSLIGVGTSGEFPG